MRASLFAIVMLASACGAHAGDSELGELTAKCEWRGDVPASVNTDKICALFVEEIAASGNLHVATLAIDRTGPHSSRVAAFAEGGQELLSLDFDVMDREVDLAVWKQIARSFASQLPAH